MPRLSWKGELCRAMQGLLKYNNKTYAFRDDHGYEKSFWAWDLHDTKINPITYKWGKLPKGYIENFDLDFIPRTVSWFPYFS